MGFGDWEGLLIDEIKKELIQLGAKAAMMSGSGTSVFGIFDSEDSAAAAVKALKKQGADVHLCYPHQ